MLSSRALQGGQPLYWVWDFLLSQGGMDALLARYPALAKVAKNNIQSGIRQQDLAAWVTLVERVQRGKIRSLPITNKVVDVTDPDFAKIRQLVTTAITPKVASTPTPGATATAKPKPDLTTAQDAKAVC